MASPVNVAIANDSEVNTQPYASESYPEPVYPLNHEEAKRSPITGEAASGATEPRICGLRRKIFWNVLVAAIVVVARQKMGWNEHDSDNPNPVVNQILTVDPEVKDGVQLTYYGSDWNKVQTEVTDLADCATMRSMAVNRAQRLYCLVESRNGVELVEWAWKGDPWGDVTTYTSWERIGTMDTTVT
ncbi:hypothetical protein F5X99DRAFT_425066 [Biscogniauxia marginata]|nr:hypothetical protein F5X99DRAFT_425066 [Biscogniauxia marginata]